MFSMRCRSSSFVYPSTVVVEVSARECRRGSGPVNKGAEVKHICCEEEDAHSMNGINSSSASKSHVK